MLHLHLANRHEALQALLLQRLGQRRGGLFDDEVVVVPNAAHRRMLSLAMADAYGICAGVQFAYLAQWLWQAVARLVPQVASDSPFEATRLAWRVYETLCDADFVATQPRLAAYLQRADAVMRFTLAQQLAAQFERLVTYRADWLETWQDGRRALPPSPYPDDEAWQAALWRRLAAAAGLARIHPREAFAAAVARDGPALVRDGVLPERLHLFALPTIAPLHLQMLQPLAGCVDVHVYAINPCAEYWFEIVSPQRFSRLALRNQAQGHEVGNRLLASWGGERRTLLEALHALPAEAVQDDNHFQAAPSGSLLATLQNAVLELRELPAGSVQLDPCDRSVEVHVCHSLSRELEVLQDHLLGLFDGDSKLKPDDVLVLLPDLELAAPRIDALFGTAARECRIPYTLGARARSRDNAPARVLLELLALANSRCGASALFALLQQPLVARRFGLDDEGLDAVHGWLQQAGFRWALDAPQLRELELPDTATHTLEHALERLVLGHALPAGTGELFGELLAAGDAEGSRALHLGALWRFAQALQHWRHALAQPMRPAAWADTLRALLDEFMLAGDQELDDMAELRTAMRGMVEAMRDGDVERPLPLAVLRLALQQALDAPQQGGAPGGGVTFAALGSTRSMPFKVVCAIGLNDGEFPPPQRPAEFDLMARQPRRGDRSPRDEARAAMLDLLLAARSSLYLSYTGRSQRDNSALPPSVLLAELLDTLVDATAADTTTQSHAAARARLVVEHPLQPFAMDAFRVDAGLQRRSFNRELGEALRGALAALAEPPQTGVTVTVDDAGERQEEDERREVPGAQPRSPFFTAALAPPGPEWLSPSLGDLLRFFRNPSRELLRRRLRIDGLHSDAALEDEETLWPQRLQQMRLAERLLGPLRAGADDETLQRLARAGDELPAGALGMQQLQQELASLRHFAERLDRAGPAIAPVSCTLPIEVDGQLWQLRAQLDALHPSGQWLGRYAKLRGKDALGAWLHHLVLCAAAPAGVPCTTRWVGLEEELGLRRCDDALAQLTVLLRLFALGLREPLHFYPDTAWALVTGSEAQARSSWEPNEFRPWAEGADAAHRLALRGTEPLDARFEAIAQQVFWPLLAHREQAT